ncbi:dihydropyrimidine dehydrogenase [Halobacteriales archaeon QH_10_67_13]|nr:MAG: dihydropyrimidine dehydrogenase [Halobacteriales archaeon QH_10_67_13]
MASLSGRADAAWARHGAEHVGAAVLGGIALDEPTRDAARALVDRGRQEFLPADPVAFLDAQLAELTDLPIVAGFNIRAREPSRLAAQVGAAARTGATVSVKLRAELDGVSVRAVGERAAAAGADLLHVDAMDSPEAVRALAPVEATVVANNGVRDAETAAAYFRRGADAVSVARPSTDPAALERIAAAVETRLGSVAVPGRR